MIERTISNGVCRGNSHRMSMLRVIAGVSLVAFLVLFGLAAPATAQLYAGSVTGLVSDPTGALIAGAEVTLVDAEKGFTFTAKNSNG